MWAVAPLACLMSLLMRIATPRMSRACSCIVRPPMTYNLVGLWPSIITSCLARAAEDKGMEAVIELSSDPPVPGWAWITGWWQRRSPKIQTTESAYCRWSPKHFASVMKKWAGWLASPRSYLANLSDKELARIDVPAMVSYGFNALHPRTHCA